jgi:hypothetical protein
MLAVQEEKQPYPKLETIRKYLKDVKDAYEQALRFFADPNFQLPAIRLTSCLMISSDRWRATWQMCIWVMENARKVPTERSI